MRGVTFLPVVLVLSLLALPAPAAAQEDLFDSLKVGQRIEIVLKNNTVFRGDVHWIAGDRIKVDVTYDTTELQGFLTFKKSEIKRVTLLQQLSQADKDKLREAKEARLRELEQRAAAQRKSEEDAARAAADAAAARVAAEAASARDPKAEAAARAKQGRDELLARFPASEWSPERYAEILGTAEADRTPEEKEFVAQYGAWLAANQETGKDARQLLLEKFPPEKGWGPEKREELRLKELENLHTGRPTYVGGERQSHGRTRPPLTDDEKEFMARYDEWVLAAQEYLEAKRAAGGTETVPAGTPEGAETPKSEPTPEPTPAPGDAPPREDSGTPGNDEGQK